MRPFEQAGRKLTVTDTFRANAQQTFTPAPARTKQKKADCRVTIRLSQAERDALKYRAGALSMSDYIRERLFATDSKTRKTRGRVPVKDHAALARVLRLLASSGLAEQVAQLSEALDRNGDISPTTQHAITQACADIAAMRADLIAALGLQPRDGP